MALILMTGFPASGKSTVSAALRDLLHSEGQTVHIISDGDDQIGGSTTASPHPPAPVRRSDLYHDSTVEKRTRARLRAATERHLGARTIVICDSLNYIKGFRYEMYCVAKTTGTRFCVVHCNTDADLCAQRDAARAERGEDAFGAELCAALIRRYETPAARNRWDSPLHLMDVGAPGWEDGLPAVTESALRASGRLAPTMATRAPEKVGVDVLGMLDRVTREAEAAVVAGMREGKGVGDRVAVPGASREVRLERKPRVQELRNMRRSYLGLAKMHPPVAKEKAGLVDEFVDYVNAQLKVAR